MSDVIRLLLGRDVEKRAITGQLAANGLVNASATPRVLPERRKLAILLKVLSAVLYRGHQEKSRFNTIHCILNQITMTPPMRNHSCSHHLSETSD